MHPIVENIQAIEKQLVGTNVKLIAVSKKKPASDLLLAYEAGFKRFGENYVQELVDKQAILPQDIEWHFIGHLQSNKVKYIAPFVSFIHSVDSFKLLQEINKQAAKYQRIIPCLLQVHIAQEDTKTGLSEEELFAICQGDELAQLAHVSVRGLMGMSTFTEDETIIREEFRRLKSLFDTASTFSLPANCVMQEISMGMSGDWPIAVNEGSTFIRVGSAIFGERI